MFGDSNNPGNGGGFFNNHSNHGDGGGNGGGGYGNRSGNGGGYNNNGGNGGHNGGMMQQQQYVKRPKAFTPVTVKMVMQAQPRPDDICEFEGGDPVTDIILTGRILRRIEEPMRTQFELNDTTGSYHVIFYHKGENQVPTALKAFKYEQFTYAKIYGNIRVFKEDKAIIGTHIKRIDKFEEITNHFLSVFVSQQIRLKGVLKARELAMDVSMGVAGGFLESTNSMVSDPPSHSQNQGYRNRDYNNNNYHQGGGGNNNNYNQNQNISEHQVFSALQQTLSSKKAASRDELQQMLSCPMNQLDSMLNRMKEDGRIANAHDNNHYFIVD